MRNGILFLAAEGGNLTYRAASEVPNVQVFVDVIDQEAPGR